MELRGKLDPVDLGAVAVLSLVATLPLFITDAGVGSILGGDLVSVIGSLAPLLLLLPLPAAYVATMSRHSFRVETLGAAVTLPLASQGLQFAGFSAGLVLGLLLVSYKSRSIYKGDNQFWTFFKASTALVTVLAVVLGITAAYAYDSSESLRSDIQGNLTEKTVDTATEFIDLSQQGLSSGTLTGAATALAENVSRTSITLAEVEVFKDVDRASSFSNAERQLLREAFSRSRRDIPSRVREQSSRQVEGQLGGGQDVERELIESRASPIVSEITRPTTPVLALIFIMLLSLVYLFKFPVALLGGVYGSVIYRARRRWKHDDIPRERKNPEG